MRLSPLNQRRWRNFTANRRAYWSMILFAVLFGLTLFAEVLANDKPLLVSYRGEVHTPFLRFYSEQEFGGDFQTEANYKSTEVQCLIVTGGLLECFDDPVGITAAVEAGSFDTTTEGFAEGWIVWAPIPYSYNTINDLGGQAAPSAPDAQHWLGTDDASRDVLARVIYGFRLSVAFALMVTALTSVIGIAAGAVQGYFGGRVDLVFQRFLEIWGGIPMLYVIIIIFAVWDRSFWLLVGIMVAFGWTGLIGVVRAEFLRARNFEYVRAARALGVPDRTPCAAQCDGGDADDDALYRDGHHWVTRRAGLSRLWPAAGTALAGAIVAAGAAEPANAVLGLCHLLYLCHDALASGLYL
jgi:microcin C transport system permease protein